MKHDEKVLQELFKENATTNPDAGVGIIDQDAAIDIMREYLEHMNRWLTTDELPESDTYVTLLCEEEFNGMSDHPITAHYCKDRNLFAENGEEIPHSAIRFYKPVTMPESGA